MGRIAAIGVVTGFVETRMYGGVRQERSPECKGSRRTLAVLSAYLRRLEGLLIFLVFAARVEVAAAVLAHERLDLRLVVKHDYLPQIVQ